MKNIVSLLMAALLLVSGCGERGPEKTPDKSPEPSPSENAMKVYDKEGISFDIPESWQNNFKAVTRNTGSSGNVYPQTDFYYTEGNRDILLMSVGKFTRDQWENLKKKGEKVEEMLLGESEDKNHIYSIRYENHDYIDAKDELKGVIEKIKKEAEGLRDKIKLK